MLVEVAAEGHNDSVMALLSLGAVLLVLQRRVVVGVLAMAAAVLTKYVPILLVPACSAICRAADDKRSVLWRIGGGSSCRCGCGGQSVRPYWAGQESFAGLGLSGRAGHSGSTQTSLAEAVSLVISDQTTLRVVSVVTAAAIVFATVVIAVRVRTPTGLVRGERHLHVIYSLLSPAYWPWNVVLPVAFPRARTTRNIHGLPCCDVFGIPSDRARRLPLHR